MSHVVMDLMIPATENGAVPWKQSRFQNIKMQGYWSTTETVYLVLEQQKSNQNCTVWATLLKT